LTCRLWDIASGRLLDLDLPRNVTDLRASFSSDGLFVLTSVALAAPPLRPDSGPQRSVGMRVWDATGTAVGQPMRYPQLPDRAPVESFALEPDDGVVP
jgi:hypothetical protein